MTENHVAKEIVDSAYKIHQELGPGLLESIYEVVLAHELRSRGLHVERQLPVPIIYQGIRFEEGYRLDLLVNSSVIVEIKSIEEIAGVHKKQLLSYLRLMDKRLGLLINFNVELIKHGISRVVNGLEESLMRRLSFAPSRHCVKHSQVTHAETHSFGLMPCTMRLHISRIS